MRILLVQPPSSQHIGFQFMALTEPLGLEAVAAVCGDRDVRILDLRIDVDALAPTLADFRPDVVGVTVPFTTAAYEALTVLETVKAFDPKVFTLAGGNHATLMPEDFVGRADLVVIGEGEEATQEALERLDAGEDWRGIAGTVWFEDGEMVTGPERPLIRDLDAIPIPRRDLTRTHRDSYFYKKMRPMTMIETARGCPFKCSFCSVWMFNKGKYRTRTPERVMREILTAESNDILFSDDNFLENVRRSETIYDMVKAAGLNKRFGFQARTDTIVKRPDLIAKWAEIGLTWVLVGFESFRETDLKSFDKRTNVATNEAAVRILQSHGVDVQAAFIVDPCYSPKEFKLLARYIRRMKLFNPQITILTPIPGTHFFREKLKDITTRNWELFDFLHAVIPTDLPLKRFYREFTKLYRRVSVSHTVGKFFRSPHAITWKDFRQGLRVANNMLRAKAYLRGHFEKVKLPSRTDEPEPTS